MFGIMNIIPIYYREMQIAIAISLTHYFKCDVGYKYILNYISERVETELNTK